MTKPLIVFRALPGVEPLESRQMIAEKFHEELSQHAIDDLSRDIFGIVRVEIAFEYPEWFADGFDSFEEWHAAPEADEDDVGDDFEYEEEYPDDEIVDESPERQLVKRQEAEFYRQMDVGQLLNDDYDRMAYARTFGFDFADSSGQHPLRITKFFFWQALAAARGVKGHLPDLGELGIKEWGSKIEEAARKFRRQH